MSLVLRQALAASLIVAAASFAVAADSTDAFDRVVRPFLARHCYDCHGPNQQKAQLRYDRLQGLQVQDRHLWTLIHEQLAAGRMPPEDRPQPAEAEKHQVLAWIEQHQRALGAGGMRRLNRRELSAALQDLTGLTVDFAAALPGDGKLNGFDTGADSLQDAADSLAQVMLVTRRAVEGIRFLESASGKVYAADFLQAKDARQGLERYKSEGVSISNGDTVGMPGTGLLLKPKWVGERGGMTVKVPLPVDGDLRVLRLKVVVSMEKYFDGLPNPRLWVEIGGRDLDYVEINNPSDQPRTLEYQVALGDLAIDPRGISITVSNRVEVPYSVPGYENDEKRGEKSEPIPGGIGLFRPLYDRKQPRPQAAPVPYIALHQIEIEPDYRAPWPPAESVADSDDDARRLLQIWIERAWRRPVSEAEQRPFFTLYKQLRAEDLSFDESLRAAFQSVLLSPSFRYLASPGGSDTAHQQHVLASRLSFMLWGAPPDAQLRQLAAAGKLRDPAVLDGEVDRLLADSRSEGFLRPFVLQWLEMGQPITIAMDHIQKQDFRFGRYLKASMQEETIAYVGRLLSENRPARELIDSDWTMMNDILARHYGYQGIEGGQLRKVTLRPDDPRGGGILGQAGIQSMLCWMGENWLIYRGAWTLRHILDAPPPPPPLEVPELLPSDPDNHGKPFKELLRQHQEDARCSVCHKTIDPLGFAFQNFDLSGRWRDVEYDHYVRSELDGKIAWYGTGQTRPVDAAGRLPRGEEFDSFAECKELLVQNYLSDVVGGLLKNLVIYGCGRQPDIQDLAEVRTILAQHEPQGYPLKDLLKALVRSRAIIDR
jgi:hypothetical protein